MLQVFLTTGKCHRGENVYFLLGLMSKYQLIGKKHSDRCMHVCMHVCMYVCMWVCMCVGMFMYMCDVGCHTNILFKQTTKL